MLPLSCSHVAARFGTKIPLFSIVSTFFVSPGLPDNDMAVSAIICGRAPTNTGRHHLSRSDCVASLSLSFLFSACHHHFSFNHPSPFLLIELKFFWYRNCVVHCFSLSLFYFTGTMCNVSHIVSADNHVCAMGTPTNTAEPWLHTGTVL